MSDDVTITRAPGAYLAAPQSVSHIIGRLLPLVLLNQAVEGRESRQATLAQVVRHVRQHSSDALALVAIDAVLACSGYSYLRRQQLVALGFGQAAAMNHRVPVATNTLNLMACIAIVQVVACGQVGGRGRRQAVSCPGQWTHVSSRACS